MQHNFVKIGPEHKDLFGSSLNSNHQFMHCVVWGIKIMQIKSYIFLSEPNFYNPSETVYSFFPLNNVIDNDIVDIIADLGIKHIYGVDESTTKRLQELSQSFIISENRDDSDYLYKANNIAELSGADLYTRRRLYKTFKKRYPHLFVQEIAINMDIVQSEVFNVFVHWMNTKFDVPHNDFLEEMAVKRLIDNYRFLDFKIYGIYDQGALVAFITTNIQDNCAYINFVKADLHYKGINEYLFSFIAQSLVVLGVNTINFEEDAGILGLRQMKRLWRPYSMIDKYDLIFKNI